MKIKELREKNQNELTVELEKLRAEKFRLRLQKTGQQLKKTSQLSYIRRQIARTLTLKNEFVSWQTKEK